MVEVTTDNEITFISLNRPEVRNAWNPEMIQKMISVFGSISTGETQAMVIRGNGGSFSAGADLKWLKNSGTLTLDENLAENRMISDLMESFRNIPVPVIAVAEGSVFGGALGLLSLSDWVLAETSTRFSFSEVRLGLAPAIIMPYVFRRINPIKARQLMLTGKVFTALEARECGLADLCGSRAEIESELNQIISVLRNMPNQSLAEIKRLAGRIAGGPGEDVIDMTIRSLARLKSSEEAQSRLNDFINR
jgi:methylglutaconyl-CoA hydratase